MFSVEERVGFLNEALAAHENVEVDVFSELVVDFAQRWGAKTMVKGLRVISDFEWEFQMTTSPNAGAGHRDALCDGEPTVQLRLVEWGEGDPPSPRSTRRSCTAGLAIT